MAPKLIKWSVVHMAIQPSKKKQTLIRPDKAEKISLEHQITTA